MTESAPVDHLTTAAVPAALGQPRSDATDGLADELRFRQNAALEWRGSAGAVAHLVDLPEATEASNYLRNQCVLGIPVDLASGDVLVLKVDGNAAATVSIDRLREQLLARNQHIANNRPEPYAAGTCLAPWTIFDVNTLASLERRGVIGPRSIDGSAYFNSSTDVCSGEALRAIFLPKLRTLPTFSDLGRGTTLLYQARYALTRQVLNQRILSPASYWLDEAKLFKFEFDVLERLCGDVYADLVSPHAENLRLHGDTLKKPGDVLDRRRKKALKNIFEGARDRELHVWNGVAERNAIMNHFGGVEAYGNYLHHVAQTDSRG